MQDETQKSLFDKGEGWEQHWSGMPEFEQRDLMPYKTLYVHFRNREDMEKFSKLLGQQVLLTTKSVWYPEASIQEVASLRWIDEREIDEREIDEREIDEREMDDDDP